MITIKSLEKFIEKPVDILKASQAGPVEISDGEQPYVIMTSEYLRRLLADTSLADQLDETFAKLKKEPGASEQDIMNLFENR